MKILFTGGSSFTGMWFIKELLKNGHEITATFSHSKEYYNDLRLERINQFIEEVTPAYVSPFGSESFLRLLEDHSWDLVCHHGADVTNYRDPNFNVTAALENNTKNIFEVIKLLKRNNCDKILLTGSIFEPEEGEGSFYPSALSPYGLSKGMTSEMFEYYCYANDMKLGKFVISNPFGPYEEKKLSYTLMEAWHKHSLPTIKTPLYIRDNIHVSLLARVYADFAENLLDEPGFEKVSPAGYVESLKDFTERVAIEMRQRLPWECEYEVLEHSVFSEPGIRINTDLINISSFDWNEEKAWNDMASYYDKLFNG